MLEYVDVVERDRAHGECVQRRSSRYERLGSFGHRRSRTLRNLRDRNDLGLQRFAFVISGSDDREECIVDSGGRGAQRCSEDDV